MRREQLQEIFFLSSVLLIINSSANQILVYKKTQYWLLTIFIFTALHSADKLFEMKLLGQKNSY